MPRLRQPTEKPKSEAPPQEQIVNDEAALEAAPELEVTESAEVDSAALALKKQVEDLQKSEELQKKAYEEAQARADQLARERDDARRQAQLREQEIAKFQKEATDSQFDSIANALSAAKAEAERAKTDLKNAINLGDADGQADAYERLADARAAIGRLEEGKAEIEAKLKEPPPRMEEPRVYSGDPIDQIQAPESAKAYLKQHRELFEDPKLFKKTQALFQYITEVEGVPAFSTAFYAAMDRHHGFVKDEPKPEAEQEIKPAATKERSPPVSAPVSREAPSASGGRSDSKKVTLTKAEIEAAGIAGVTLEEYAKNKLKLAQMRADGSYGDRQ